jgi:spore photoproduct lyase
MRLYLPQQAYIDPKSLKYEEGRKLKAYLEEHKVPIIESKQVDIDYHSPSANYMKAKNTILVTTTGQKKLAPCKPSADFQFALSSSCPGNCEYCYLQTTQGEKPVIKIFVNVDDILNVIQTHIDSRKPEITFFEAASITDPVGLEHLTGGLRKCIDFFGKSEFGRLRLVTKFSNVDSFLDAEHNGHTKFRFSINARYVIRNFEHNTASFEERIEASKKIAEAGYPIGFIIAPIMIFEGWKEEYKELIERLKTALEGYSEEISFELIQHRFTSTAKELILSRFENTKLDMEEENRDLKWGPYGKFKYVYKKAQSQEIKEYITELLKDNFPNSFVEYFT